MRKAYLAIKYYEDQRNRDKIERLTTLLVAHGVETICVARDVEQWGAVHLAPPVLMEISFGEIEASDVVIVELSEKGVGLGIEAGYAYARRIPIITLARQGADISTTLEGISSDVFLYSSYDALDRWLARCAHLQGS